jgi:hypothetical protein
MNYKLSLGKQRMMLKLLRRNDNNLIDTSRQMALASSSSRRGLLPPSLMKVYSPNLARNILRKTSRSRPRFYSYSSSISPPRPYTFHIGASWAGKRDDNPQIKVAFPPDTLIGMWRDKTLSRPKAVRSQGAGEDFFFVQEVLHI